MALNMNKSPEEVLQEEFLQEKAAVLGRAGNRLLKVLEELRGIESCLDERLSQLAAIERSIMQNCADSHGLEKFQCQMRGEINLEINRYNGVREDALIRYYYLIVTREAMGLRRHHWVERLYPVPPRKKTCRINDGQIFQTTEKNGGYANPLAGHQGCPPP